MKLDTKKISNIEWDGINPKDYPDFTDAFAIGFDYGNREATDDEIDLFNDSYIENYHDEIIQQLC